LVSAMLDQSIPIMIFCIGCVRSVDTNNNF
jgi:hypothetical protein